MSFRLVAIPSKPWHKLRVMGIAGELNQFHVESETLECLKCHKMFGASQVNRLGLKIGGHCPARDDRAVPCGGTLDCRFHRVDLSAWDLNGGCSCEHFSFALTKELSKQRPEDRVMGQHQCKHIQAAIAFNSLVSVEVRERERHKHAHGQREEDAA